jgi:hypothetical protein
MKTARNRLRWKVSAGLLGLLFVSFTTCIVCAPLRHGHIVREARVPNHQTDFDFTKPPCEPAPRPEGGEHDLLLRYLGVSGVYLEWKGASLLTAPFFSNYGLLRVGLRDVGWDEEAIRNGLSGLPVARTGALIAGHSHYDHIADLPPILLRYAPNARVWVNRSGVNMLSAFEALEGRLHDLNDVEGQWIRLRDVRRIELPFRILPLASEHAPHYHGYHFADGEVTERWAYWQDKSLRAMKEGRNHTFLIDLLEEDSEAIAFRIFYQDAAGPAPLGFPPEEEIGRREVDLAILCMPSYWEVEGYPEGVLERTRARHTMITHYEDFLRPSDEPLRFVATLTDERVDGFIEAVVEGMSRSAAEPVGPVPCTCGPCGPAWSMPLPGEWLRFETAGSRR